MPKQDGQNRQKVKFSNILWIMVVLSMVGIAIVYALDYFEVVNDHPAQSAVANVEFTIAASSLHAPQNWLQTPLNSDQTALNALELNIPLTIVDSETTIGVTLLPASKAAPSAYLLDTLYIHKFDATASDQAYGLIIQKLKAEEGFEDEVIWYDALSATPFVAKCLAQENAGDTSKNCITTRLVNKRVSALIRFEQTLLPHWREFATAMDNKLSLLKN